MVELVVALKDIYLVVPVATNVGKDWEMVTNALKIRGQSPNLEVSWFVLKNILIIPGQVMPSN